jgi:hypothetical protein
MRVDIHEFSAPREVTRLPGLLTLPFRGRIGGYAINRRQWSATLGAHGAQWHYRGGPVEGQSDSTTR